MNPNPHPGAVRNINRIASGYSGARSHERRAQFYPESGVMAPSLSDIPINILIVDDEPKNLTVLETVLDNPDYRLVRAESADQALLALVEEEFALIILDIRMPGMTGFELAEMIKQRKKTARVPIIFLTAFYNDDQHVMEGYSSGAVDYLHKPINPAILRSKVAVFAELHRKTREYVIANSALVSEVTDRRRAQEQLRELNETLEQRVIERTQALMKTSAALNESGERYRSLFENSLDAIFSLNKDGRFEDANPSVLNLTGRTLDELKGLHFQDICAPDQREAALNAFRAAFNHECINMDTVLITASGERRDLFISGAPAIAEGKRVGIACIARDITDRKRIEAELKNALITAENANHAKSDFLSSMSHELRTPLNAILGFAQLLQIGIPPPSDDQNVRINQIIKAGWYLLELINGILDLAVIESGKLVLVSEPVSLRGLMQECQTMVDTQAKVRGLTINFHPFDPALYVNADQTRLKQVVLNLLSNGIKYNHANGTVEVTCTASAPDRIRISIKDTGIGLPPEKLSQLFQPFNRLGQESGTEEGTGIGLMVTKQLVELMGGKIGVESTVGVGSEFWIELIREGAPHLVCQIESGKTAPPKLALHTLAEGKGRTLLYVEDNPANLMLVKQIIEHQPQIRMLTACDGSLGLALARNELPDVILMDINLPGISGREALDILRDDPKTTHIPVIALSANAMPHDIAAGMHAGFFHYLTKPIKVDEFMSALDEALKLSEGNVEQASEEQH